MIMEKVIRLEGLALLLVVNYLGVPCPNSKYCIFIVTSSAELLFYQYAVQSNQFISEPLTRRLRFADQSLFVTHQEQEQHRHQQKQQVVSEAGPVWRRPGPLENLTIASTTCSKHESELELV